jgi:hypothetical protein
MSEMGWRQIVKDLAVPARPESGMWTLVHELIQGPCLLKISATGNWWYTDEAWGGCGPDGGTVSAIGSSQCINPAGSVGALIGKIGGGTASSEGEQSFVVGRFAVISVEKDKAGALFLTMNDTVAGLSDNEGGLTVQVYVSKE